MEAGLPRSTLTQSRPAHEMRRREVVSNQACPEHSILLSHSKFHHRIKAAPYATRRCAITERHNALGAAGLQLLPRTKLMHGQRELQLHCIPKARAHTTAQQHHATEARHHSAEYGEKKGGGCRSPPEQNHGAVPLVCLSEAESMHHVRWFSYFVVHNCTCH